MIKVIVAEDHAMFRDGLKRILGETTDIAIVAEAASGKEALKKIRDSEFDLILLDINFPDISGLTILKRLSIEKLANKVLMLSMYPDDEYAIRAIRLGASGYLTKDSPADQLIAVIRRLAAGGKYVNPDLAEKFLFEPQSTLQKPLHTKLSDRELMVFKAIAAGESLTAIAGRLSLSVKTVSTYRTRVLEKMNIKNNAQLIRYAINNHLLD
ncbi:MAG: response regulator transcription factor [Nitrosomonas sp.]|jgi:DNA-binding NarL/FixJ family response regulator|nr:response regulator transcription factor [Nitrosomonas sp.]